MTALFGTAFFKTVDEYEGDEEMGEGSYYEGETDWGAMEIKLQVHKHRYFNLLIAQQVMWHKYTCAIIQKQSHLQKCFH